LKKQHAPVELGRGTRRTPLVLKIPVVISKAKTLFELARQEGGEQLHGLTAWTRSFVQQGIEALLRAELAVVLE
jgi:hypothetical protein